MGRAEMKKTLDALAFLIFVLFTVAFFAFMVSECIENPMLAVLFGVCGVFAWAFVRLIKMDPRV